MALLGLKLERQFVDEQQWRSASTVEALAAAHPGEVGARKLLLLMAGCVRTAGLGTDPAAQEVVELSEQCAEGATPKRTEFSPLVRRFHLPLPFNWPEQTDPGRDHNFEWWAHTEFHWREALGLLLATVNNLTRDRAVRLPWEYVVRTLSRVLIARQTRQAIPVATAECGDPDHPWHRLVRTVPRDVATRLEAEHVALIRCVFGNPFHPVTFSSEWRTDTAVALARQMYEAREFSTMPILADALQDAGCANEDILNHCRAPGVHIRGCWVVDLVLGKE
jgi:hypothetical protein